MLLSNGKHSATRQWCMTETHRLKMLAQSAKNLQKRHKSAKSLKRKPKTTEKIVNIVKAEILAHKINSEMFLKEIKFI